jgi:hypothetical protein
MSRVKKSDLQKVAVINDAGVVIKIMYTPKDQDIEDNYHIINDSKIKSQ